MPIKLKRAYDPVEKNDGVRILVERLWPRGVKKADLKLDDWVKTLAPSTELRQWYDHDPDKWDEFQSRYKSEISEQPEAIDTLCSIIKEATVTFIYASKEERKNSAVVLKSVIEEHIGT